METTFEMTLDRDDAPDGTIEVCITATGDISPADESVGIMGIGVDDLCVEATDEDGKIITLTDAETREAEEKAEEKAEENLLLQARDQSDYGDYGDYGDE